MAEKDDSGNAGKIEDIKLKKKYPFKMEAPAGGNLRAKFLAAFEEALLRGNYSGALDLYGRIDQKCGRCASMCHVYRASGNPDDIPCRRTEALVKIYRRYFGAGPGFGSGLFNRYEVSDAEIERLLESFYRCSTCSRCTLECPAGIDHPLITRLGRYILSEMGMIPKPLQAAVRNQLEGGSQNISNLSLEALKDTVEFLEEDLEELTGRKIPVPIGKKNVEYVYFPPVTDFMTEAETLMGHAAVMYAMGLADQWTLGDANYEAKNYGYYYSDWIYERITDQMIAETKKLGARTILIGECGHATRATVMGVRMWGGANPPLVKQSIELLHDGLRSGKIRLNPDAVKEKVTYHDPCNIGRNGGLVEEPRNIVKSIARDFVDMTPSGRYNYCCGAGPASMDDMKEFRMTVSGRMKAEQLKRSGAGIVIAPCANCKKQIRQLIEHDKLEMECKGLFEMVTGAIVWD